MITERVLLLAMSSPVKRRCVARPLLEGILILVNFKAQDRGAQPPLNTLPTKELKQPSRV